MMKDTKRWVCIWVGLLMFGLISSANGVTNDRWYQLGDDSAEGANVNTTVGTGNSFGDTFDSAGTPGEGNLQDLSVDGTPTYVDVTSRPGAVASSLGVKFDGVSNRLWGLPLNRPDFYWEWVDGFPDDYTGITSRGIQLWVKPDGTQQNVRQDVLLDSTEFGGPVITADNKWAMAYDMDDAIATLDNDGIFVGTGSAADVQYDQWTHLMEVTLSGTANSVLFVNGVAVAAGRGVDTGGVTRVFGYDTGPKDGDGTIVAPAVDGLMIGASDLDGDGTFENFYKGEMDEVEMFLWGSNDAADYGTFNLLTDNDYIAQQLDGKSSGDIDLDGSVDDDDVALFIANWRDVTGKIFDGLLVIDLESRGLGDLDLDGRVGLGDWHILKEAYLAENPGAPLDLGALLAGASVPEPTTMMLLGLGGLAVLRRRRG